MNILQIIYIASVIIAAFVWVYGVYDAYENGEDITLLKSIEVMVVPLIPVVNTVIAGVFISLLIYGFFMSLNEITIIKGKWKK